MFVAEAKFNDVQLHDKYVDLIKKQDSQGILDLLTNEQVEESKETNKQEDETFHFFDKFFKI